MASANVSGLFNLFRYFLQSLSIKIDLYYELFIAGCLSSFALHHLQPTELSILKVIVYPRAIENIWSIFKDKILDLSGKNKILSAILNPYRGESIICAIFLTICCYSWLCEPLALTPSLNKKIDQMAALTKNERQMLTAF